MGILFPPWGGYAPPWGAMSVVMNRRIREHDVFFNIVYLALSRLASSPSYVATDIPALA